MPDHEFIAYIDESGDDGVTKFRDPALGGGASSWLVLSSCMVRASNDSLFTSTRDQIVDIIKKKGAPPLHFHELTHAQKVVVIDHMAKLPIGISSVLSCKKHIPDPSKVFVRKSQLYWYLCRNLIERISWCCASNAKTTSPIVKMVFSKRGGLKYEELRSYLHVLKKQNTTIDWNVILPTEEFITAEPHGSLAGLDFADAAARSFAEAVEPNTYGYYERTFADALKKIVYRAKGNYTSYGLKRFAKASDLTPEQLEFFENYGKR